MNASNRFLRLSGAALFWVLNAAVMAQVAVTAPPVTEGDSAEVSLLFNYTLPGSAEALTYEWALLPDRLTPGWDFTPARGTVEVPAGPGASGTIPVAVLPDAVVEAHGALGLVFRPPGASTWAQALSAPETVQEFNVNEGSRQLLYWQDGTVISRRFQNNLSMLEFWERQENGTMVLLSSLTAPASTPDLFHQDGVVVSPSAVVIAGISGLQSWLRNPSMAGGWQKMPNLQGGQGFLPILSGDRLMVSKGDQYMVYRMDGLRTTGWRQTGMLATPLAISRLSENTALLSAGDALEVWERAAGTEDMWKMVHRFPTLVDTNGTTNACVEGMVAAFSPAGLEIHERALDGSGWARTAVLPVLPPAAGSSLSMALAGDWLAVGRSADGQPGSVELYLRDGVNRSVWNPVGTLPELAFGSGRQVIWDRNQLVTVTETATGTGPVAVRRFPGGRAVVRDDDQAKPTIHAPALLEPDTASGAGEFYLELGLPPEAPVTVTYELLSGTAVSGQDFTPLSGTVQISTRSSRVFVPFTLLGDSLVEPRESLTIRAVVAGFPPVEAPLFIRDTDTTPIVSGTATPLLEGYGQSQVTLTQRAVTGTTLPAAPVALTLQTGGFDAPAAGIALATADQDLPTVLSPVSLSAAAPSASVTVTATQDSLAEPATEAASAVWSQPEGVLEAGSLGLAHEGPVAPAPLLTGARSVETAGEWVFLVTENSFGNNDPDAAGSVRCYRRNATGLPRLALQQILRPEHNQSSNISVKSDGTTLALAVERNIQNTVVFMLELYQLTGPATAPWVLQETWQAGSLDPVPWTVMTLNQDFLAWGPLLFERSGGSPAWRLANDAQSSQLLSGPESVFENDGENFFAATFGNLERIRAYKRRRGQQPGWDLKNTFQNLIAGNTTPYQSALLHGRTAVLQNLDERNSLSLYRQNASGTWILEQTVPPTGQTVGQLVRLTENTVVCTDGIWTRTGPAGAPWVLTTSYFPWTADFWSRSPGPLALVTGYNNPVPRIQIWEPGVEMAIIDDDSLTFTATLDSPSGGAPGGFEALSGESIVKLKLVMNRKPPIPLTVRVRSQDAGSALAGLDYAPFDYSLRFYPAGSSQPDHFQFPVRILSDRLAEPLETFEIVVDPPVFGSTPAPVPFTIAEPIVAFARATTASTVLREPVSGDLLQMVEFTFSTNYPEDLPLGVAIAGGTANNPADYVLPQLTHVLPAGSNILRIPVLIKADALSENEETLSLRVTSSLSSFLTQPVAALRILDANAPGLLADEGYTTTQGVPLVADGLNGRPPGVQTNDTAPPPGDYQPDSQPEWGTIAMLPDGSFTATPGPNVSGPVSFSYRVGAFPYQQFVTALSPWRYLHPVNGISPAVANPAFPSTWATPAFDDTGWATGAGTFSYGGLNNVNFPDSVNLAVPPSGSRFTSYFRCGFQVPTALTTTLRLNLYCDDGAIIYINGVERGRMTVNTSTGFATAPDTFNLVTGGGGQADTEEGILRSVDLGVVPLNAGLNVLAISLHNVSATSSDLGLRVTNLETLLTKPVSVRLDVTPADQPPVIQPDSYAVPQNAIFRSASNFGRGLLENDGLRSTSGFYDPITEIIVSAVSTGTLELTGQDGHFTYTPPRDFSGAAGFTYQVRDKDGLSAPGLVTLNVAATRPYDLWRQAAGPGGLGSDGDADGDGVPNFLEFVLGSTPLDPSNASSLPPRVIPPTGGSLPAFTARLRKSSDLAWVIESATSPDAASWTPLTEARGLDYTYTWAGVSAIRRDETANVFTIEVSPQAPLPSFPRLFYRLRTTRLASP